MKFTEKIKNDAAGALKCFFLFFSLACILLGVVIGGAQSFSGFIGAVTCSTKLTTDVLATGGLGGGLLNVGLCSLIAWGVLKFSKADVGGASFGAFFLMAGFSFFGKTALNILPVIAGTYLYSKVKHQAFSGYANNAIFACALAPVVSEVAFGVFAPFPATVRIIIAILLGLLIGFIFSPVASHTATMHKGFNLFNAGLAAGLIGIVIFCAIKTLVIGPFELEYSLNSILSEGFPTFFYIALGVLFAATLALGGICGGFKSFGTLIRRDGYKTDFSKLDGAPAVFVNFGVLGIFGLIYLYLVKAPMTGPSVGALFCMLCWAANGSHIGNVWPIFLGYLLVSFGATWNLGTQAIAVGIMFASGMSPLAGKYKFVWGTLAGALHAFLVTSTAGFHGGLNGYNGGFTSGLVAMTIIAIIEVFSKKKEA